MPMFFLVMCIDCPIEVEDLNQLAQMHDPNKEDAVDYALFTTCKKFISKVCKNCFLVGFFLKNLQFFIVAYS